MNTQLTILLAMIIQSVGLLGLLHAEDSPKQIPDLRTRKTGFDWPTFLGPNGNSKSEEKLAIKAWPDSGPPVVWHKEIGEGYGAPSISRGRLLVFDRTGDKMRLTCLNSETGKGIWTYTYSGTYEDIYGYSNGPRTSPVIDEDRVYIFGVGGILHCLNLINGSVIWKVDAGETFGVVQNFFGVGSTPVVEGDLLIAAVGGSQPSEYANVLAADGNLQGNGSGIVAFNKLTGQVVYKSSDQLAGYASPRIATVNDKRTGFLFTRGGLLSFAPRSGDINFFYPWRSPKLESVNASNPVIVNNSVFVSECYSLGSSVLSVKENSYEVIWKDEKRSRNKSMELHWTTAVHHNGYLYAGHGRSASDAAYRCVELATGNVVWSHKVNERSSVLYVNEHFIGLGERGTLTLFKAIPDSAVILSSTFVKDNSGEQLIQYPSWAAPVLSNGFLYLRSNGRIVCLDLLGV